MTPVYFPFTFISQPVAETLTACFGPTVVYQPLDSSIPQIIKNLEMNGLIHIRVPLKGDEEKIIFICKDYRKWIDIHQGSEREFLKIQRRTIPFFDDSYSTQIKAAIKRNGRETLTPDTLEQIFAARVFLYAAQQFDRETWEISRDLISVGKMEKNLVGDLRGETPELLHPVPGDNVLRMADPGDYMTVARIKAWARLFLKDQAPFAENEIVLFITISRSVFEHVMDIAPESRKVLQMDVPPSFDATGEAHLKWRERFVEYLQNIAKNDRSMPLESDVFNMEDSKSNALGSMAIHLVHKTTPQEFFMRCIAPELIHDKSDQPRRKNGKILVGVLNLTN